jgi:hypothetical protein
MTMKPVLHSFAYCLDFLREQVADVAAADMVAQPNGIMNHPAWVIGHLTYTCQQLGGAIGQPAWLPNDWAARFGTGSVPVADAWQAGGKLRGHAERSSPRPSAAGLSSCPRRVGICAGRHFCRRR